jgi:very-short-patch-repair endonuclease
MRKTRQQVDGARGRAIVSSHAILKRKQKAKTARDARFARLLHRRALKMQQRPTGAEAAFWALLATAGLQSRFEQQKPILHYIMDFYCADAKLCIEIDGASHKGRKRYDLKREADLLLHGIKTIRFYNSEVTDQAAEVIQRLCVAAT